MVVIIGYYLKTGGLSPHFSTITFDFLKFGEERDGEDRSIVDDIHNRKNSKWFKKLACWGRSGN